MSVVTAAPPAKTAAPAAAPAPEKTSSTDTPAQGADFASLLLGQLAAGMDLQPALPEDTPLQTESSITAELTPQDPALLLASLGIVPPEQALQQTGKPPVGDGLPTLPETTDALSSGKAGIALPAPVSEKAAGATLKNEFADKFEVGQKAKHAGNASDFIPPAAYGVDDKAAKIAVTDQALPKTEALAASTLTNEASATGAATISPHTPPGVARNEAILKVETPVRDQSWAADFSQKVVWLASNDKQVAQLTLNPPQMGPIEISLNLNKDGASALFVSQSAEVREAIETAMPRLREMLADVGIELGQANVSAESFRQQAGGDTPRQGAPRWMADNAILGGDPTSRMSGQAIIAQHGSGLVNIFA